VGDSYHKSMRVSRFWLLGYDYYHSEGSDDPHFFAIDSYVGLYFDCCYSMSKFGCHERLRTTIHDGIDNW